VIVPWGQIAGAAQVRVDLLDHRARRIARAKAGASVGAVTFKKPPSEPLTVELLTTSPSGRVLLNRCMRVLRSGI
jgi:hypothetical protein